MSQLKLFLLGPPRLERGGEPVEIGRRRAVALLAYLVVTGESHSRDALSTIFWPDFDQSRARTDLRRILYVLNEALGREWLEAERETVALSRDVMLWLDVAQFQRLLADCNAHGHASGDICAACLLPLTEAVALYHDDFLAGFTLPDSPDFDEWQFFQTESLRQELLSALDRLVRCHIAQGSHEAAIPYARRWLALDPLQEPVHRILMQLYAWTGQQSAALRQYQVCVQVLEKELGVSPDEETTQLYQAIRAKRISPPQRREPVQGPPAPPVLPSSSGEETPEQPQPVSATSPTYPVLFPTMEASPTDAGMADPVQPPARSDSHSVPADSETSSTAAGSSLETGLATVLEEEIRVATVLVANVSHTADTDWALHPEETANLIARLLQTMEEILEKYEARLERFLGEGVQAVFGTSHIHEDDPERAIWAALEIREIIQEFGQNVTVGINTGELYFNRPDIQFQRQMMGPAVNLAARLQEYAESGQILAGETTYRQTRRAFRFAPVSLNVKGITQPVSAYQVLRPRRRPEKSRGIEGLQSQLVGRDEELAKLKTALDKSLQGQGQLVSLIGEAGVGKSRLVAELRQVVLGVAVDELHPRWLEGRCLEMGLGASYWPFIDIFRDYFAWRPDDDQDKRARSIVSALQQMVKQGYLAAEQQEEMAALLGNLLSVRSKAWDERLRNASPEQVRHRTFLTIHDFFVTLARQQPVVLVFEDLHWADSLSLDLVSLLMEALPQTPLLLLCLYRPEPEHQSWRLATLASRKCPERYTEIQLRELTPQHSRQLVESLLTTDEIPDSVKELILEKSQGNPLFVEEVMRSLIDAGMIYREENVWRVRQEIETIAVPASLQSIILNRVDRLEPVLKQILQAASVIGHRFRRRVLAQVMSPEVDLNEALRTLEDQGLIYQERIFPEEEYSFKHILTQATVYQTIPRRRQAETHRQAAEAMEMLYQDRVDRYYEQIAYHYGRSDIVEKTIEYLLKAGEKARRAYLTGEAISYFWRVLERLEIPPSRAAPGISQAETDASPLSGEPGLSVERWQLEHWQLEAQQGLGQIYLGVGQVAEAEAHFRQAIALGRKMNLAPQPLVRLYFWLGEVLLWQDRFKERIEVGQEGLALASDDVESVEMALMNQTIAAGYNYIGERRKFLEFTYRTAQFIRRLPYSEELRPAYHHIVEAFIFDKNLEQANNWLQTFEQQAQQHHDLRAIAETHFLAGTILARTGDLRGAIAREQQALELFTKIGDAKHRTWPLIYLSWSSLMLGDLHQAEEYIRSASETVESVGRIREIAQVYENTGAIFLCQGEQEKAVNAFREAARRYQEIASPYKAEILLSLGQVYLAQGQREAALEQFREALNLVESDSLLFAEALAGLEAAYGDAGKFGAFCRRYQQERPEAGSRFAQWYLEPAQPVDFKILVLDIGSDDIPGSGAALPAAADKVQDLEWYDPFGDCSFTIRNGLEIQAANGRDLWFINVSAPRLLHPVAGDFAVQTVCVPASLDKSESPAIGGLLLWKDEQNYLRLDQGAPGRSDILFGGCLENKELIIGRGHLALDNPAAPVFLRLERSGRRVNALCSPDGLNWLSTGQVELPVAFPNEDLVEVGLHAIGYIDRVIYPGAHAKGTAIRFKSFRLWR